MKTNHSHRQRSLLLGALCLIAGLPWAAAQRMSVAEKDAAAVTIETATVSTEVAGRYAVTTFDLVFRNPNNRPLEGTFEFPLLEGQSVIRFALDIDGTLREAVPVEKEKGRVVFEEIERRRVDPGLLEQTAGNNYRARVFPLPAQGTRRIVIAYQEELGRGAGGGATYRLPLAFPSKLARFDLGIAVCAGDSEPARASTTLALELPAWSAERTLKVSRRDFAAQGVLELALPPSVGQSLITQKCEGREYFSAEVVLPEFPAADRATPRVVGLLWDASGSGRGRDHAKEYAFLDAWFRSVPAVEVRLVRVRNGAEPTERFIVRRGDWAALRQALEATVYDGATSLDGVARDREVDEWLLFSDGLFNYGRRDPGAVLAELRAPVHAVLAVVTADATRLRAWSRASGGELANLTNATAEQAAAAVRRLPLRVWGVERDPEAVAQVFPEAGSTIAPDRLAVAGVLRRAATTVRLRVGRSEREAREVEVVVTSGAGAGSLAARAWATAKIEALSLEAERNRDDIRRTSLEFGIVTAGTSLIVLESAADYALYEIEPPAELRREWKELRRAGTVAERKSRESHLDAVAADFAARIKWWETRPEKTKRERTENVQGGGDGALVLTPSEIPARTAVGVAEGARGGGVGIGSPEDEVVVLSPFVVASESDAGYHATSTLAGTRVRTELRDIGSAISVVTDQFLRSSGATDSGTLMNYTTDTEVSGSGRNRQDESSIALQPWTPAAGYLDHLKRVAPAERYATYLEERADHVRDVGFFVDVAGYFLAEGEANLGLRILSNLAELELEDAALLRILGHRLLEAARADLAVPVFERVLLQRGEEPQSRRDLALACAANRQYQRAVDLLWEVVEKPWHGRFPGIELLALGELNSIVATCGERLDLSKIDQRLRRDLPVGLRVVLTWDADNCDIDLWVDDPDGERAFYGRQRTTQGGLLSCDFTGGYGPEEFMIRRPLPGKYTVRINYFGDRRNTALGPVTAQVRLITGYGTPDQKEERMTVRLDSEAKVLEIGSIEISR